MTETTARCPRCQSPVIDGSSHCSHCGNLLASAGEKTLLLNTMQRNAKSPWAKLGSFLKNEPPPPPPSPASPVSEPAAPPAPVSLSRNAPAAAPSPLPNARTNFLSHAEGSEYSGEHTVILGRELGPAPRLVGWLVATEGPGAEQDFRLLIGKNTIGRGADAMVRLSEAAVSNRHAIMWCEESGEITLVDQDSQNGLLVNGKRIFKPTELEHGDVISFGGETRLQLVRFIRT